MNQVFFKCRKCDGYQIIYADNLLEQLKELSEKPCPYCGEEPWTNWVLAEVVIEEI